MNRPILLTGSRCYGAPRPDSDIDLVVFAPPLSRALFALEEAGIGQGVDVNRASFPLRFGVLNLIVCKTAEAHDAWAQGTEALVEEARTSQAPVSRQRAVEVFAPLLWGLGGYQ